MNPVSEIRAYIKKAVREIDGKFIEHDMPHTSDNVGALKYDKTFFINFPGASVAQQSNYSDVSFDLEIELGAKGESRPIESHDSVVSNALDLTLKLMEKSRIKNSEFYNFSVGSITPTPIQGNERWTKVTIRASVTFGYMQEK